MLAAMRPPRRESEEFESAGTIPRALLLALEPSLGPAMLHGSVIINGMAKTVDLLRHTESEGDALTQDGVRAAVALGGRLTGRYDLLVSSGAQRATQTLACVLAGSGQRVAGGVTVETGFRSAVEDRWREAAKRASGKDLEAFQQADPELVEKESTLLGSVLRNLFDRLPENGRA
ncbi:MAG: histidine phosphatase family protein, partial [Chloroflexi bacterium]